MYTLFLKSELFLKFVNLELLLDPQAGCWVNWMSVYTSGRNYQCPVVLKLHFFRWEGLSTGIMPFMQVDWLQCPHLASRGFVPLWSIPHPTRSREEASSWSHHCHPASRHCAEHFSEGIMGKKNHPTSREVWFDVLAGPIWLPPMGQL